MSARRVFACVIVLVGTFVLATAAEERPWWLRPADDPALAGLGDLDTARAVAIAPGGATAAAAYPEGKDGRDTALALRDLDTDGAERIRIPGEVRALRFVDRGSVLLAVVAKRSKRRPAETHLVSIEVDSLRARRLLSLPHTATDLDVWPEASSIILTSRDELRTFRYPDLSSGPLFRLLGQNFAIAHVSGSMFVVSNERGLLVVDLSDRPGEEEMPARARLDPGATVIEVALMESEPRIAARREGGVDPIRFEMPPVPPPPAPTESAGVSDEPVEATATVGRSSEPTAAEAREVPDATVEPGSTTETSESAAEAVPIVAEIREAPDATPEPGSPTEPSGSAAEAAPIVAEVREAPDETPESPSATAAPSSETTTSDEPAAAAPGALPVDPDASIVGRVEGRTGGIAIVVVAQGPDNLLKEAARTDVRADGSFVFTDLAPGSYRLVLDAGGERHIESDPPFQLVRVEDDGNAVDARAFRVLRVR